MLFHVFRQFSLGLVWYPNMLFRSQRVKSHSNIIAIKSVTLRALGSPLSGEQSRHVVYDRGGVWRSVRNMSR